MEKKNANMQNGTQGYTLVELITVMAIVGILGTMLVSMLNIGVKFYRTADTSMDNQNNARLAIAYITVKIRQNDVADGISVDRSTYPVPVLIIKDASSVSGNTFWIYFDDSTNKLREQSRTTFDPVLVGGAEITENLRSVDIEQSGANIHFEVKSVDGSVNLTQDITLRSSL